MHFSHSQVAISLKHYLNLNVVHAPPQGIILQVHVLRHWKFEVIFGKKTIRKYHHHERGCMGIDVCK